MNKVGNQLSPPEEKLPFPNKMSQLAWRATEFYRIVYLIFWETNGQVRQVKELQATGLCEPANNPHFELSAESHRYGQFRM